MLLLPAGRSAASSIERVDVAVIGAGLSGLCAARRLTKKWGADVRVLEARDRVGGRTLNQPLVHGRAVAEGGGQWVGPSQDAILALLDELGVRTFPSLQTGDPIFDASGDDFGALAYADYTQAAARLDRMARKVSLEAPWESANAGSWDAMSVADWLGGNMFTSGGRSLMALEVDANLSAPAAQVSLLGFLFYIRSAGSLKRLSEEALTLRIDGGAQLPSLRLAKELGGRLATESPVLQVDWDSTSVRVRTPSGQLQARHLIVAMMPRDVERIRFTPELPPARKALQVDWPAASGAKFHCAYPSPFWRERGLSGDAVSESRFIGLAFDNSPPDGSLGVLGGFAGSTDIPGRYR